MHTPIPPPPTHPPTDSGATESNNLAIKGVGRFYKARKNHIITLQTVS